MHLRDALDLVSRREPGLILRFGGHAMAAGLAIEENLFGRFSEAFEQVARELLTPGDLERVIETDGALTVAHHTLETAQAIENGVWGQGFATPAFAGEFEVDHQRVVGERHLKLKLKKEGRTLDAMLFFHAEPLPPAIHAVYQLGVNEYNGLQTVQLTLRHWGAL